MRKLNLAATQSDIGRGAGTPVRCHGELDELVDFWQTKRDKSQSGAVQPTEYVLMACRRRPNDHGWGA